MATFSTHFRNTSLRGCVLRENVRKRYFIADWKFIPI